MNKLKFIKIIVCLLTFLLVSGAIMALNTIYKKANNTYIAKNIELKQPHGSSIVNYKIENNNVFIFIKGGGTSDRIIVADIFNKKPITTIKLN